MTKATRKISHGDYYLDLVVDEDPEDNDNLPIELINIKTTPLQQRLREETGSKTAYIRKEPRNPRISGFRRKRVEREEKVTPSHLRVPKKYAVTIKYHYPLVYFPESLENELKEVQNFFKITSRGSGSTCYRGKMASTLGYRVSFNIEKTRIFARTIVEILDRYGVEIYTHEIIRIK